MLRLRTRRQVMDTVGMTAEIPQHNGTELVRFQWKRGPIIRGVHQFSESILLTAKVRSQTSTLRNVEIKAAVDRLLDYGEPFHAVSNTMRGKEKTVVIYWHVVKTEP